KQRELRAATQLLKSHPSLNHRQTALLASTLKNPDRVFTIREHQGAHKISYPTARGDLVQLADMGFLELVASGQQKFFYPSATVMERLRTSGSRPLIEGIK